MEQEVGNANNIRESHACVFRMDSFLLFKLWFFSGALLTESLWLSEGILILWLRCEISAAAEGST